MGVNHPMAEAPPDADREIETVTSADGTAIAVERTGSGPPLVLVHGTSADYTTWSGVRPAFEEHVTVYAIDRRGRGESGDAAEYALEREFEDVAAVVDSIDESVVLLGHSFGALCALEAARRTSNLHKLILYEPVFPVGNHEFYSEDLHAEIERLLDDGENEQALVLFLREIVELSPEQLDELRAAPNWPARVDAAHTVLREDRGEYEYKFDAARFEEVTTPTLLLSGSESSQHLRDVTAAVNDALPNSRIAILEGQEHVAYYTAPDLFVDEVLAFIRKSR
jgi:pimeloyl-ACP methyl ester carboxylesterase